ncbi:hypothetical protein C2845_PM08G07360 [Panicum miliaceum]|uniref:Uncharacterized protein n=1 Tax=Panicum miliaceum TaxID=4540 RepID=A0A3L6R589_PANMI|nr:hypothetical protein C2845_PM08G07360 [Panicum miliaceum]
MGTGDGAGGSEGRGRGTICRTRGRGNKRLTDLHYSSVQLQVRLVFLLARECLVQLGFNQLPAAPRGASRAGGRRRSSRPSTTASTVPARSSARASMPPPPPQQANPTLSCSTTRPPARGRHCPPFPTEAAPRCSASSSRSARARGRSCVLGAGVGRWAASRDVDADGRDRCGADMPPPWRPLFVCATVGGRVFVVGRHDEKKNALRSAAAYDAVGLS